MSFSLPPSLHPARPPGAPRAIASVGRLPRKSRESDGPENEDPDEGEGGSEGEGEGGGEAYRKAVQEPGARHERQQGREREGALAVSSSSRAWGGRSQAARFSRRVRTPNARWPSCGRVGKDSGRRRSGGGVQGRELSIMASAPTLCPVTSPELCECECVCMRGELEEGESRAREGRRNMHMYVSCEPRGAEFIPC